MTFDELFAEHRLTARERKLLVWHLAALRARRTVERLLRPKASEAGQVTESVASPHV